MKTYYGCNLKTKGWGSAPLQQQLAVVVHHRETVLSPILLNLHSSAFIHNSESIQDDIAILERRTLWNGKPLAVLGCGWLIVTVYCRVTSIKGCSRAAGVATSQLILTHSTGRGRASCTAWGDRGHSVSTENSCSCFTSQEPAFSSVQWFTMRQHQEEQHYETWQAG